MCDFTVKVLRVYYDANGRHLGDGCFFSKVFAIENDKMLVYDNRENTTEESIPPHFVWVSIKEAIETIDDGTQCRVQYVE